MGNPCRTLSMKLLIKISTFFILLLTALSSFGQHSDTLLLDTIVVHAPPVVINKDTIEYNTSRFKTRDYAVLEDLLQILPGIQLNNDGSITVNGQVVDKLMVDGKPFFDGSPAVALTHLPADIVRQIQVYATKTGPNSPKTLNVILKPDKRKGSFGKVMAGAGSGEAYTSTGDINYMNGAQQMSLIGDAGNVEKDRGGNVGFKTYGITRNINGGLNYRDSRSNKTSIFGSVLASNVYSVNTQRMHILNIFPDNLSTIQDQEIRSTVSTDMQNIHLNLEHKPDNKNTFLFQPRVILQHSKNSNIQQSLQQYEHSGDTMYRSAGDNISEGKNTTYSSMLQYIRNWKQPGKTLTITANISANNSFNEGTNNTNTFSAAGNTILNQQTTTKNNNYTVAPYVSFITPLGEKNTLNIQGNYTQNISNMSYHVYRFNDESHQFDIPDTTQSNNYKTDYKTGVMEFTFGRQWEKITVNAGTGIQADWLSGNNHTLIKSRYINMLPSVSLSLLPDVMKNIQIAYNGKPMTLSMEQLQPFSMTADSLYISEGNPDLKQPYTHTMQLMYNAINLQNNSFFSAMLMGVVTENAVQQSITLRNNGAQVTRPVNLNGSHNIALTLNYGLNNNKKRSVLNMSANLSYNKSPLLSNGVRNDSRMMAATMGITYNYQQTEGFNLMVRFSQGANLMQNKYGNGQHYFITSFNTKASYFKGSWEASLAAEYDYNTSLPSSFQPMYPITVPSVAFRVLKHKEGQFRLSVMDIFNQRSGASRTISLATVTDSWSQTRGRYIIGTFTYNFRKFGGKK